MRAAVLVLLLLLTTLTGCFGGGDGRLDGGDADPREDHHGFSDTHVFPGTYDTSGAYARTLQEGPYKVGGPEVVRLESDRDGAIIEMELYRPQVPAGAKVPVIMMASPYFDDDLEPREAADENTYAEDHFYGAPLLANYPAHGYALALVAVRGSAGSGGCIEMFGPGEQADLNQVVTWLGTRPWSNGNVGMIGISYDGAAAWEVAATGNPHLKTIVPAAGPNDLFSQAFRNGTWAAADLAAVAFYGFSNTWYGIDPPTVWDPEARVERAVCPDVATALSATMEGVLLGTRDSGGFWEDRNHRPGVQSEYTGSVFLIHGLNDLNVPIYASYPWVDELSADGTVVKHLIGPWRHVFPDVPVDDASSLTHNPTPRYDLAETLLHWFDRWLKEDPVVDLGPVFQVADNHGRWRSEASWPPDDAQLETWHLTPEGDLSRSGSDATGSLLVGTHVVDVVRPKGTTLTGPGDPCPTCAVFRSTPIDEDLRFAGSPLPHLFVTPLGPGGYLTTALYAVDAEGQARLLTDGAMDLRFADGGDRPRPVVPGVPLTARMALDPVDAVVPAGSRLVLIISQGTARDDGPILTHQLYMTLPDVPPTPLLLEVGAGQSVMTLRTFERGPGSFFEPPEANHR